MRARCVAILPRRMKRRALATRIALAPLRAAFTAGKVDKVIIVSVVTYDLPSPWRPKMISNLRTEFRGDPSSATGSRKAQPGNTRIDDSGNICPRVLPPAEAGSRHPGPSFRRAEVRR